MKTEKKLRNSVDESFTQSLVSDDDLWDSEEQKQGTQVHKWNKELQHVGHKPVRQKWFEKEQDCAE